MEDRVNGGFSCEEVFNNLLRKPSLFIDERFFNVNNPVKIIHREDALNQLLILYMNLILKPGFKGINQFIAGENGVGKTATVKFFCEDFIRIASKRKVCLKYIHINCKKEQTWYKVLVKIIRNFKPSFPKRGYAPQDLLDFLAEHLIEQKLHLLIVLDDLDYLLKKDSKILYCLTRLNEDFRDIHDLISIIAIMKDVSNIYNLIKGIRTHFQVGMIKFEKYNKREIFDILKYRIIKGLKPNAISDDLIEKLSELVYEKGDLRYGLNLLWKATKIAESKRQEYISTECIEAANKEMAHSSIVDILENMSPDKLLLLLSIVKDLKDRGGSHTSMNSILDKYIYFCKLTGLNPKSYSQIWNYLQEYKMHDLIFTNVESKNIRGRRALIGISQDFLPKFEENVMNVLSYKGVRFLP